MLDFKVEKIYKDTNGRECKFKYYRPGDTFSYTFEYVFSGMFKDFYEQEDGSVTGMIDGTGIKIPFAGKTRERDWVVGEEYECFDVRYPNIYTIKLVEVNNDNKPNKYRFKIGESRKWFMGKGDILSNLFMVVFKNGIPQELKDKLNKKKLTNKQKCFQKGKAYETCFGGHFIFKKRINTKDGLFIICEDGKGSLCFGRLYRLNNVECVLCLNGKEIFLCANESIRNEDASKAVRIKG